MIINEKVKFVGISTFSTDFYEENISETTVHRCSIGKRTLKMTHPICPKCNFWALRKKIMQGALWFFAKRNPIIFQDSPIILWKKKGFYANKIK